MRLSSSMTSRCAASSERGRSFSGAVMAGDPRSRSALNELVHLVALAVVDDLAQELLGAFAFLRRQGVEGAADTPRLQIDEAERQRAPGFGRIEEALAAVERPGLLLDEAGIDEL